MIVITTPTGQIGSRVVADVLSAGADVRVVARDPSRLDDDVRERVDVVTGSTGDADVMSRALEDADALFWLAPGDPTAASLDAIYSDYARPACAAIADSDVTHVVAVSSLGRGVSDDAGHVTATLAMDDLIASTGVAYRALACPSFMDNVLRQVQPIAEQGVFRGPITPDLTLPTCATRDIGAAGARLLLDRSWSGVDDVPLLGPEDLSHDEMAEVMTDVLGRPVRYERVSLEALKQQMLARGSSEAIAQGLIDMYRAKDEGLDSAVERTPQNTTPTTFRAFCEQRLLPAIGA